MPQGEVQPTIYTCHRNHLEGATTHVQLVLSTNPVPGGKSTPVHIICVILFYGSLRAVRALTNPFFGRHLGVHRVHRRRILPTTASDFYCPAPCSATSGPKPTGDAGLRRGARGAAAKAANITQAPYGGGSGSMVRDAAVSILSEERRVNNLTAGALRGPGLLALPPLVRARRDESEGFILVHVGRGLCGHDGIVHGGLLATLLDEALARTVS
jgi:hypothetical protein